MTSPASAVTVAATTVSGSLFEDMADHSCYLLLPGDARADAAALAAARADLMAQMADALGIPPELQTLAWQLRFRWFVACMPSDAFARYLAAGGPGGG
jgi:hypothetical protein